MNDFVNAGDVAAKEINRWKWWQDALKGNFGQASESHPEQGYYRTRFKGGQWEPVAVWFDEETGKWLAYRNGREARDVNELWVWSMRQPISFEAYEKAMAGGGFEDEPPAPIGDNSGETDPFAAIKIELAGEAEQLSDFMRQPVKTQADADRIGIWSKRLTDISKRADAMRVAEKEPHLAASRAVDDKFREIIADAKDWAARAKKHVEAFLIAEKRKAEEAARKAREEAEKLRLAALEKQQRAADYDDEEMKAATLSEAQHMAAAAQEAEKAAEPKNASAGRTGARVSVRTVKVGVVTDYEKAALALVRMKHKDMLAEIDRLAKAAGAKSFPFDGMEIREEEKVV